MHWLLVLSLPAVLATADPPRGPLFRFDGAAIFGPTTGRATLYLTKKQPPGGAIGRVLDVDLDGDERGRYLLRLELDESKLPAAARPGRVRVVRRWWLGWDVVPAWLTVREDGKHAVVVHANEEGVYAVVLGARRQPPPSTDLLEREPASSAGERAALRRFLKL